MIKIYSEKIKFIFVGIFNTSFSYFLYSLFFYLFGNYFMALIVAYVLVMVNSYLLNKIWVFKSDSIEYFGDISKFIIVNLISMSMNLVILYVIVDSFMVSPYLGQLASIIIVTTINYFGYKRVFKNA